MYNNADQIMNLIWQKNLMMRCLHVSVLSSVVLESAR